MTRAQAPSIPNSQDLRFLETQMNHRRTAITRAELLVVFSVAILLGLGAAFWMGSKQAPDQSPSKASPAPANSPSEEDRQLIAKQKICPVSEQPLDSMGEPYRTEVEGKVVFVCCKNCTSALKKDPEKYLAKLK
jgi:YHS domain-containing protein